MRILETNRHWLIITVLVSFLALLIHVTGQTAGFTDSYFGGANWYNQPGLVGYFMSIMGHSFSSMAVTAIILNFNLPLSFRWKWIVTLIVGISLGIVWEFAEYVALLLGTFGWLQIAPLDTLSDLWLDFLASAFIILLYIHMVRVPRERRVRALQHSLHSLGWEFNTS